MTGLLALVMVGQQVQSCIVQQTFAQPVYQQGYANQVYDVRTIIVPTERVEGVYLGLVGAAQRAEQRQAQAQQATASTDAKIDRLTAIIEALQKRIGQSEPALPSHPGQQVPSPPLPSLGPASEAVPPPPTIGQAASRAKGHPGLASLTKSCAGCHQGTASKGGGVVLFASDGSWSARDADDLARVEAAIASRRMPKGPQKLTLRESANILNFLDEQAGQLAVNTTNQRKKVR